MLYYFRIRVPASQNLRAESTIICIGIDLMLKAQKPRILVDAEFA